jgi:hypothetical protein
VKLHVLHALANIFRRIKSRRMKVARYVTHLGKKRNAHKFWTGETSSKIK